MGQKQFAPDNGQTNDGLISYEDLTEYMARYDIRTGKRRVNGEISDGSNWSNKRAR